MADLVTNAEQLVDELTVMLRDAHRVLAKARVQNANPEGHNQYTGQKYAVVHDADKSVVSRHDSKPEAKRAAQSRADANGSSTSVRRVSSTGEPGDEFVSIHQPGGVIRNPGGKPTRNDDPDGRFITVRGHAVFIPKGKDVGEALKEQFAKLGSGATSDKFKGKGAEHGAESGGHARGAHQDASGHGSAAGGHGGHGEHAGHDPLEHAGHEAHAAQDIAAVHEALGGGHAAHAAIHDAHAAAEAAHAAGDLGHHGAGPLDAAAIGARHLYGPALKATSALMGRVPGLRTLGKAVGAVHKKATALNQRITEGLISRYGKATAGAILGVGSAMSHTVSHGVGLHGPAASALPGPHLIGALPFVAMAEVGKRLGLVGEGTKLERGLATAGAWVHALRHGAAKGAGAATGKVATAGLKGAHLAGRLVGKVIRGAKRLTGNELTELTLNGFVVVDADSLDLWNALSLSGHGAWVSLDDLAEQAELTENELVDLLEFVVNAEPEDE